MKTIMGGPKMAARKWLYVGAVLAAILQSGLLYAGIEKRASILRSGREVVLLTQPVDPRDLMRGDYVTLGYDISSIERAKIKGPTASNNRVVYVAVKSASDGMWVFSRAAFVPIADVAAEEVQIRGETLHQVSDAPDSNLNLHYGIERYYVPEGEGRDIESGQRERRITAVIAVSSSGAAQIKALRDNGRPLYEEPLY